MQIPGRCGGCCHHGIFLEECSQQWTVGFDVPSQRYWWQPWVPRIAIVQPGGAAQEQPVATASGTTTTIQLPEELWWVIRPSVWYGLCAPIAEFAQWPPLARVNTWLYRLLDLCHCRMVASPWTVNEQMMRLRWSDRVRSVHMHCRSLGNAGPFFVSHPGP